MGSDYLLVIKVLVGARFSLHASNGLIDAWATIWHAETVCDATLHHHAPQPKRARKGARADDGEEGAMNGGGVTFGSAVHGVPGQGEFGALPPVPSQLSSLDLLKAGAPGGLGGLVAMLGPGMPLNGVGPAAGLQGGLHGSGDFAAALGAMAAGSGPNGAGLSQLAAGPQPQGLPRGQGQGQGQMQLGNSTQLQLNGPGLQLNGPGLQLNGSGVGMGPASAGAVGAVAGLSHSTVAAVLAAGVPIAPPDALELFNALPDATRVCLLELARIAGGGSGTPGTEQVNNAGTVAGAGGPSVSSGGGNGQDVSQQQQVARQLGSGAQGMGTPSASNAALQQLLAANELAMQQQKQQLQRNTSTSSQQLHQLLDSMHGGQNGGGALNAGPGSSYPGLQHLSVGGVNGQGGGNLLHVPSGDILALIAQQQQAQQQQQQQAAQQQQQQQQRGITLASLMNLGGGGGGGGPSTGSPMDALQLLSSQAQQQQQQAGLHVDQLRLLQHAASEQQQQQQGLPLSLALGSLGSHQGLGQGSGLSLGGSHGQAAPNNTQQQLQLLSGASQQQGGGAGGALSMLNSLGQVVVGLPQQMLLQQGLAQYTAGQRAGLYRGLSDELSGILHGIMADSRLR